MIELQQLLADALAAHTKDRAQYYFDAADQLRVELGTEEAYFLCAKYYYKLIMKWGR